MKNKNKQDFKLWLHNFRWYGGPFVEKILQILFSYFRELVISDSLLSKTNEFSLVLWTVDLKYKVGFYYFSEH